MCGSVTEDTYRGAYICQYCRAKIDMRNKEKIRFAIENAVGAIILIALAYGIVWIAKVGKVSF